MTTFHRGLLAVPLLLVSCLAQAAHFELIDGSVIGSTRFEALTDAGELVGFTGAATSVLAAPSLSGAGVFNSAPTSLGGGALTYSWQRSADLSLNGGVASFAASGDSALAITGVGGFAEWTEASQITLSSSLRIVGDRAAEATGSAVRVDLLALSAFTGQNSLGDSQRDSQFELRVFACCSDVPVHWLSTSTNVANFDELLSRSFVSQVGAELTLELSLRTAPQRGGLAFDVSAEGLGFATSDALTGQLQLSAVPEPAQYALWLLGLAGLGACLRRQR